MCIYGDCYVTNTMSSSENGLPDAGDPMAIGSGATLCAADLGYDLPTTDGIPSEDPFVIPTPVCDHLILDHPDGEHVMAPILAPAPLVAIPLGDLPFGDLLILTLIGWLMVLLMTPMVMKEDVAAIPLFYIPVIEISSDTSLQSVSDSFESVTSYAL
ncbi:hypothetical protein Hanom_Chr08g00733741 [Helianthus anomalus]